MSSNITRNHWFTAKDISLAIATRDAGFDLAIYDNYSDAVQAELKKRSISEILENIRYDFIEQDIDVDSIDRGVYVITLSAPLSISYMRDRSQVIYIGMGNLMSRFKSHFQGPLFNFMQSLSGSNFDIYFAFPDDDPKNYHKHVEYEMLEYFSKKYGGVGNGKRFPILNKNAGAKQNISITDEWWKKPLKNAGKRPLWTLQPTSFSEFGTLD